MGYKFVLLDADETLFDFRAGAEKSFFGAMEDCAVEASQELLTDYMSINDGLWKKLEKREITKGELLALRFYRLFEKHGITASSEKANKCYMDRLATQAIMIPHAEEVCKELCEYATLYIVTNGDGRIQRRRLAKSEISRYISGVFISQEIGYVKPQKEFFDYAAKHIQGFDSADALIVGDSPSSDIAGANNAGIDACYYNPGHIRLPGNLFCKYEITDLRELFGIVR